MGALVRFIGAILSEPAVLIGLFALIGLLLQKSKPEKVITGTLKAILGFVILGAGAGVIVSSLDVFSKLFTQAFKLQGVIPNNEVIVSLALNNYGVATAWIMVFGMIVNLVIARFTRFKYIFLTGHHTLFMSTLITAVFVAAGVSGLPLIVSGSLILGTLMVLSPAILQPFTKNVIKNDNIALGHFGSLGYLCSALVGKVVGNKSKSTEELNVPKSLSFLRDSTLSIALTMTIFFLIVGVFAGSSWISENVSGGKHWLVFLFLQALTFAAGVYIIMAGVRMLISEIVPAFKGISDKLIPNAKPALDCPTVFPFAPNAVVLGFICSFIAGIIAVFILPVLGLAIIVPGLVPHFFTGATAGVYGNATGGRRGAVIGSFVNGLIISFLPALLLPVLGELGYASTTFGDADFGVVGILLGLFGNNSGSTALVILSILFFSIPFVLTVIMKNKDNNMETKKV